MNTLGYFYPTSASNQYQVSVRVIFPVVLVNNNGDQTVCKSWVDADEIEKKKLLINSKETVRSNQKAARLLKAYLGETNQDQNFEQFDAVRMNEVLSHFYMNARKQDGEFYKATTFENMRHAINRYLKDPPFNRKFDIIKDDEFRDANVSFKAALAHRVLRRPSHSV